MATKNRTSANGRQEMQRSDRDSIRWAAGLVLFFAGLFFAASVLFYFLCWRSDLSVLQGTERDNPLFDDSVENLCGRTGAWIGEWIVGRGFGLFGMLLPVMMMLVGVRIIRRRSLFFNHSILSLFLIMILGSLTLGFLLDERWNLIASSGWGGALGIEAARMLHAKIGAVGTAIVLLGGWILTGVYINRRFINTVNSAGNAMMDRGGRIVEMVRHKVVPGRSGAHEYDEDAASEPPHAGMPEPETAAAAGVQGGTDERAANRGPESCSESEREEEPGHGSEHDVPMRIVRPAEAQVFVSGHAPEPAVAAQNPAAQFAAPEPESPFLELNADDGEPAAAAPAPTNIPEGGVQPRGRVVMGDDGLIELDFSDDADEAVGKERDAVVDPAVAERLLSGLADDREPEPGPDGLVEYTLGDDGKPAVTAQNTPKPSSRAERPLAGSGRTDAEEGLIEWSLEEPEASLQQEGEAVSETAAESDRSEEEGDEAAAQTEPLVMRVVENEARQVEESRVTTEAYDPLKDLMNYCLPPVELLENYPSDQKVSDEELYENKRRIVDTFRNFGIPIMDITSTVGPTVTLYEIVQEQGVRISKIQGLENDIAQSLKALGIRIIAPIPGKGTIGIEVPNRHKRVVSMYSAVMSPEFQSSKAALPVVIGRTIQNQAYVFDLAKMPHLLVAGATGQGKSVGLNAIITSLLYRKHPAELKFVLIDPKMVEFSLYTRIERHFLARMESEEESVVTDPKKAVYTLNALCIEMDNRLELCKKAGARNIAEYNAKFVARRLNPQHGHRFLPYIVVVVDEFADLIMMAREVEGPVMRLAQKARAIGIHLIIATQRPDVKVITGGIKANFPARMAFRVMQMIDSRTIIDQPGANQLIGRGDMLFSKDGELTRIQCALVDTPEVERIVDYIARQQSYTAPYPLPDYTPDTGSEAPAAGEGGAPVKYDVLFAEIARAAVTGGSISTSMIQRNYEVGFNRAGRIMMQLERAGIVGRQEGVRPRDILYHDLPSLEAKLQELGLF